MLCEFAGGARGTFEASRTIVGPESQMAFDVYGTEGALGWNLEALNELRVYRGHDDRGSGYTTVLGGDRFPHHGAFVPGAGNAIGFEDLVTIEDYEFCRAIAEGAAVRPGFEQALAWAEVQAALLRSAAAGSWETVGSTRCRRGGAVSAVDRAPDGPRRCGWASSESGVSVACTPSCSAARSPGPRWARCSTSLRRSPRQRGTSSVCPSWPASPSCWPPTSMSWRSARALTPTPSTWSPPRGPGRRSSARSRCRWTWPSSTRALAAVQAGRGAVPDRLQSPLRSRPRLGRRGGAAGEVGEPHLVRISSRDPAPPPLGYVKTSGGLFLDMMIHDFDMARFVTGSEVVEVFARGAVRIEPTFGAGRRRRHRARHARARERLSDRDRQLSAGRLRIRSARRGVRGRGDGVPRRTPSPIPDRS